MTPMIGLLMLALMPAAAPLREVQAGMVFDSQLEYFTQLAMEGKTQDAVAFLRQPGFMMAVDGEGHTALFAAAVACNTDVLDQVLARAPQLNHRDKHGATALFYAASQGRNDVLHRLIRHGADVNLPDASGKTPLIVAVMMNHPAAVKVLLDAGAEIDRQDADGGTALLDAVEAGRVELAQMLLKHGANPLLARNNGTTPIQAARGTSNPKMVNLLRREDSQF